MDELTGKDGIGSELSQQENPPHDAYHLSKRLLREE